MKKLFLFFALLLIFSNIYAQKIHSTNEILKIMNDSKFGYEIKTLDKQIPIKDYSEILNHFDGYVVTTDSGIVVKSYDVNKKAKPLYNQAENYFQSEQMDSAMLYYKLALKADTSLYFLMTYIGQTYETKQDHSNAIIWYKKAIAKNYIDYMAHWFLSDNYVAINDVKSAVDEIAIASILNRNNIKLKKSMISIFAQAGRDTTDWYFNPQIEIKKISDNLVSVAMNEKWIGYGMAKALWTYEPGYSESMGIPNGQNSTLEDKECLISLLVAQTNTKTVIKNDPQLKVLKEASENKYLDDYIIYEMVLPRTPFVAYQFTKNTIIEIKDYILNIRNKKK